MDIAQDVTLGINQPNLLEAVGVPIYVKST